MNLSNESWGGGAAYPTQRHTTRNVAVLASDLLPLVDFASIFLATFLSTFLTTHWLAPFGFTFGSGNDLEPATWMAALLAAFIFYDKRFGAVASRGQTSVLVRSHVLRFVFFAGVILALAGVSQALGQVSYGWLTIWFATTLLLTSLARLLVARSVRHLQHRGVLTEVIAVVGAGPVADRLVETLRLTRPETIELLGIFDDKIIGATHSAIKPDGSLAQLIELGKTRKIDWILLTLPPTAELRVLSIVQRLKALSVSIGLCPQHVGLTVPFRTIDYVGDNVPVSLLADRPIKRWEAVVKGGEEYLPRWIMTLGLLPLMAIEAVVDKFAGVVRQTARPQARNMTIQFDNYDVAEFADVAAGFGLDRYGYVVTPNADHIIRLHEEPAFRAHYSAASYVLLDSRFLARVLRVTKGINLPVCTGSDLTAKIFSSVISPEDPLVLIGSSEKQAQQLRERYALQRMVHLNPPMGFIHDPEAVETCLRFIEAHSPFRFCLLAVGTPQGEAIAQLLKTRGVARGLTLCIGASINFLTGDERRAPLWMQRGGIEWLFRLLQSPRRMANRYLVRGPRVFGLLRNAEIVLRKLPAPPLLQLVPVHAQPVLPVPVLLSAVPSPEPAREPVHRVQAERRHRTVRTPGISASI